MLYHAIGLMSGSSLDGLDLAFCRLEERGGNWTYEIEQAVCMPFPPSWSGVLPQCATLPAKELLRLHTAFGIYLGECINTFIQQYDLQHRVQLVAAHGHTVFHNPAQQFSFQLGHGAALAATCGLPVISELRAVDMVLGGQGAPIVPVGEKLLWQEYDYFLNLGGICNISITGTHPIAFDIAPCNRVLNLLAMQEGNPMDLHGMRAREGRFHKELFEQLNALDYYKQPAPKSLPNEFGTEIIMHMIDAAACPLSDAMYTYCRHVAEQISVALLPYQSPVASRMLVTGGGAYHTFLIDCIGEALQEKQIAITIPDARLIEYKEALIMALIGILRWREEPNVLASVTGARQSSIGGSIWAAQDISIFKTVDI